MEKKARFTMFQTTLLTALTGIAIATLVYLNVDARRTTGQGNPSVIESGYNFSEPAQSWNLPDLLKEISGIAPGPNGTLYCIQDERGTVYVYDLASHRVVDSIPFGKPGDYEEILFVEGRFYILRSDATIFSFSPDKPFDVSQWSINVTCDDVEGLAYDAKRHGFYIACKSDSEGDEKEIRRIGFFHRDSPGKLTNAIQINTTELTGETKIDSGKKKKPKFNPSGLAIHPHTGELYVLSGSNPYIAIFRNEKLRTVIPLPRDLYYQPEGIAFTENGDLYISSEGSKKGEVPGIVRKMVKK